MPRKEGKPKTKPAARPKARPKEEPGEEPAARPKARPKEEPEEKPAARPKAVPKAKPKPKSKAESEPPQRNAYAAYSKACLVSTDSFGYITGKRMASHYRKWMEDRGTPLGESFDPAKAVEGIASHVGRSKGPGKTGYCPEKDRFYGMRFL